MSFNQRIVKNYAGGALVAFAAPWTAYTGSRIALTGVALNSVASTAGLVIACASPIFDIEWDSLAANVQTVLSTASLTVTGVWQVSNDATNWVNMLPGNGAAYAVTGLAGATTTFVHAATGVNPGYPYLRWAATVTGAGPGGAGDNVTVSYQYRRRWTP